jgi:hypothetical protein
MNVYGSSLVVNIDGPRAPAERLSHPKDGALAQQPKAERAPHSAVVRPQAARKSRSTISEPIGGFVSRGPVRRWSLWQELTPGKSGQGRCGISRITA